MIPTFDLDDAIRWASTGSPGAGPAARLASLDALDGVLARGRARVADARARVIADAVAAASTREVAADLGLSIAAVAKAVARARDADRRNATTGAPAAE